MKKVIGGIFVALLIACALYADINYNLMRYSVYYAKHLPHRPGTEPVLVMLLKNLYWIDHPDIPDRRYDFDGHATLFDTKRDQNSNNDSCLSYSSHNAIYCDGSRSIYNFNDRYEYVCCWGEDLKFHNKDNGESLKYIKQDMYKIAQPVIDAQTEPRLNLQLLFNWRYAEKFLADRSQLSRKGCALLQERLTKARAFAVDG